MASVQPPAAMPPNGGMMMPHNITKEMVQQTFQKYQQMKQSGVSDSDPELIKARNLLAMVQKQTEIAKQRMQFQQQKQVQMQQAQQNQASQQPMVNGSGATNGASANAQQSMGDSAPSSATDGNGEGQRQGAPLGSPVISPEQLTILRNQVAAFKRLSRNLPVPPEIQARIFPSHQDRKPATPADVLASAEQVVNESAKATPVEAPNGQATEPPKESFKYTSFISPYSFIDSTITYGDHSSRQKRQTLPSVFPTGVDVEKFREERENILYNRLVARKAELEKLPATLASWDTSRGDTPTEDDSIKLKALIEYKMLCLLPKQRLMRQQISREMIQADNLAMTANRSVYRRSKKQSLREARLTEKLEQQQRNAREIQEKKKQNDFLKAVVDHSDEIRKAAVNQKQRTQKLGRLMQQTHNTIEKEEQKRIERTAKQRLQALKANDEETYLKLLGQAKDSRISHLLKQTDGFLKQLAASVKEQQRSNANRWGDTDIPSESESEADVDEDDEARGRKVDYYEVAHRIKEEVTKQSSNLVGGTLKEYQLKGLQWMISLYNNNLNGILADEMGLGKTIQTISLVTYLIEKKQQPGPYLVIVPLSTLTNWNNEFEKWAPSVKRIVYKGPPNARKQQQNEIRLGRFQVLLTTYEFIIKDRPILSKIKWLHMIVDEGHRMKNAQSKLSSTITQYYSTRYRLILTGTPLQNNLPELWALLNFVLPNIFKSVKSFDEWFNTPFANTGGQDKMELTEEEQLLVIRRLHKVLRPFLLRRLKKDVEKDLPDKQERVIKCNFSSLQAKLYKQLVTNQRLMVTDSKGAKIAMRGLSNMLMQSRKLCNHPFVFEEVERQINPTQESNDLLWRTAGKFELLDRILPKFQATGHRVLMFFQMTQIMNIMEDFLRMRGIQYLRLDGSTKADDRSELLKLFNAPGSPYFIFLLSTRAGGLGLNLQTADTVIIYDSDWNPHQDLQAQDRAHRIGQKNEVRILRLITSNSVEEKILEKANYKLDMDGKVIQAGKFDNKSTNEEREALLRVMLESAEAAEALDQDEMDDDDLNLIMMRSENELEVFQKIDRDREKNSKYGPPPKKFPRLMAEHELPDIYLNDEGPTVDEVEEVYGRGARERTRVKYDDGLTEEQWLDAVDNDEDTIEDAIARKEARINKRATNKEKRIRQSYDVGESPAPSKESDEESVVQPQPKKRGRKPKAETQKRKAEEQMEEIAAAPPKKRGRQPKVQETLSPENRAIHQKIFDAVYDDLLDLSEKQPDGTDAEVIGPFMELPDKNYYPDYYQLIRNPICMSMIQKKINRKEYQSLKQFRDDVGLLCNNCRTYNEDTSILFRWANFIEETLLRRLREETADYPELQNYDESVANGDSKSSAPQSSVGTPLASGGGGRKLKLKFDRGAEDGDSGMLSGDD